MSRLFFVTIFIIVVSVLARCTSMDKEFNITIVEETILDRIPSGSGVALWKDSLYIVSDDAPFIYQLSLKDKSYNQFPLDAYADVSYRIPKPVKPDFEAAAIGAMNGREYLFAFGSGSLSPTRDSLLIVDLANMKSQRIISLTSFYRYLQQQTGTSAEQWNIEGAAITHDTLVLFNRGNNGVMEMAWDSFTNYLSNGQQLPAVIHYTLELPEHEGNLARISGACELNKQGDIIFCASIEDTPNWYSDGPVLGSYVGIYNRRTRVVKHVDLLVDSSGKPLKEKTESIEVVETTADGRLHVLVATDDDKGSTKLLRIAIGG